MAKRGSVGRKETRRAAEQETREQSERHARVAIQEVRKGRPETAAIEDRDRKVRAETAEGGRAGRTEGRREGREEKREGVNYKYSCTQIESFAVVVDSGTGALCGQHGTARRSRRERSSFVWAMAERGSAE